MNRITATNNRARRGQKIRVCGHQAGKCRHEAVARGVVSTWLAFCYDRTTLFKLAQLFEVPIACCFADMRRRWDEEDTRILGTGGRSPNRPVATHGAQEEKAQVSA